MAAPAKPVTKLVAWTCLGVKMLHISTGEFEKGQSIRADSIARIYWKTPDGCEIVTDDGTAISIDDMTYIQVKDALSRD